MCTLQYDRIMIAYARIWWTCWTLWIDCLNIVFTHVLIFWTNRQHVFWFATKRYKKLIWCFYSCETQCAFRVGGTRQLLGTSQKNHNGSCLQTVAHRVTFVWCGVYLIIYMRWFSQILALESSIPLLCLSVRPVRKLSQDCPERCVLFPASVATCCCGVDFVLRCFVFWEIVKFERKSSCFTWRTEDCTVCCGGSFFRSSIPMICFLNWHCPESRYVQMSFAEPMTM